MSARRKLARRQPKVPGAVAHDAIFHISDGRYIACFLWTVFEVERRGDMLGMLYRDPDAETWTFRYRHRWYADDKHWESEDTKSAYDMHIPLDESEDLIAAKVLQSWQLAHNSYPGGCKVIEPPRVIWVRSDRAEDAGRILKQQSFASIREAEPAN